MTMSHHPTEDTLMRYAAGTLGAGPALVVSAHLERCPECRARVHAFEAVGGALLDACPPELMAPDALARIMARIDADEAPMAPRLPRPPSRMPDFPGDIVLPEALKACEIGPWRWYGPGVRMSKVAVPGAPKAGVMLLRVAPGRKLPEHGHEGTEFTQILYGSYTDSFGTYRAGDLTEMDDSIDHQPVVDRDGECICLAALDGEMVLRGFVGRMMQPFVRF